MAEVGGWLSNAPSRHTVRYVNDQGREYDLVLVRAVGLSDEPLPGIVVEHPDGTFFYGGQSYSSLDQAFHGYGCVIVDFRSVDPAN